MKNTSITFIALLFLLMLTSCSNEVQSPPKDIPGINVKDNNWNTYFKLSDDPILSNSHKNGENLILGIENLSNKTIVFPENFNIKVITYDDQNWVSVQNNMYGAGGANYLPTRSSYPLGLLVIALPYVSNLLSPINIRVIIVGYTEDNDKEPLGAYLDVILKP